MTLLCLLTVVNLASASLPEIDNVLTDVDFQLLQATLNVETKPVLAMDNLKASLGTGCDQSCHTDATAWRRKCTERPAACGACEACGNFNLYVHSNVPGIEPSTKFACQVRDVSEPGGLPGPWRTAFVYESLAEPETKYYGASNGYKIGLANWTHSWVSYEVTNQTAVEVLITKLSGSVTKAQIHKLDSASVRVDGFSSSSVSLTITGEGQIVVDTDGAMDDQNTAEWASLQSDWPVVHSFSIFANPMLDWDTERPNKYHPDVKRVYPNETLDTTQSFPERVVYFEPGVHNLTSIPECCLADRSLADQNLGRGRRRNPTGACCIGDQLQPFQLWSDKTYYIPGDAWLDGWMKSRYRVRRGRRVPYRLENTKVFGYGVLSGRNFQRRPDDNTRLPTLLSVSKVLNTSISGLTLVDHIYHHVTCFGMYYDNENENSVREGQRRPNTLHHIKIVGWRTNGDGVHVHGWWNVHDMFLRTADDSIYVGGGSRIAEDGGPGQTYRRIITWNDANGAPFIFTACKGGGERLCSNGICVPGGNSLLEDALVPYFRKRLPGVCGGVFDLRHTCPGHSIHNFTARNIRVTDKFPTCPLFDLTGDFSNMKFENVHMDSYSALRDGGAGRKLWACPRMDLRWTCPCSPNLLPGRSCWDFGMPNNITRYITRTGTGCHPASLSFSNESQPFQDGGVVLSNVTINGTDVNDLISNESVFHVTSEPRSNPCDTPDPDNVDPCAAECRSR